MAAIVAAMLSATGAGAQQQHAPRAAQIDRNGVLILIRSTLLALHQANETGNYTVLRDLGAPGFQQNNNAVRLGEIFANLRSQKVDLSGVAVLDPQLTLLPQIEGNGLMHMAGFFRRYRPKLNLSSSTRRWTVVGAFMGFPLILPRLPLSRPVRPPLRRCQPTRPSLFQSRNVDTCAHERTE